MRSTCALARNGYRADLSASRSSKPSVSKSPPGRAEPFVQAGPRRPQVQLDELHRVFREPSVGGDLPAEDVYQGCAACFTMLPGARSRARRPGPRPRHRRRWDEARVGPDDVALPHRPLQVPVHRLAEVAYLLWLDCRIFRIALVVHVGGADEGVALLVGDGEHDPPVASLKQVAALVVEQPGHDDVAALYQPDAPRRGVLARCREGQVRPRSRCVYDEPRRGDLLNARQGVLCDDLPDPFPCSAPS